MIGEKDSLLKRLSIETKSMESKIEQMEMERKKYITKVEMILGEQKGLRNKDQSLFN